MLTVQLNKTFTFVLFKYDRNIYYLFTLKFPELNVVVHAYNPGHSGY